MKVAGSRDLPAAPERVWAALADPDVLELAVPDCREIRSGPPLRVTAGWRLAALDGTYVARVEVDGADEPTSASLRLTAQGGPGTLTAAVRATLRPDGGGTRLDWEADCEAGGRLATVGTRVLEAAVRRQVEALLEGVGRHLAGPAAAAPPARESAPARAAAWEPAPGRPPAWGPFEDGPEPATDRVVLAAVAGALVALAAVWLIGRLRGRR